MTQKPLWSWARWVRDQMTRRGWTQADLVRHSNSTLNKSVISRWLKGERPNFDNCVLTAEAFGAPALEALVAARYLSPEQAFLPRVHSGNWVENATSPRLLTELGFRIQAMEHEIEALRAEVATLRAEAKNAEALRAEVATLRAAAAAKNADHEQHPARWSPGGQPDINGNSPGAARSS